MISDRAKYFREVHPDSATVLEQIHSNRHPISLYLDGIHDIQNVGAILRLADAARLEQVLSMDDVLEFPQKKLERFSRSANRYVSFRTLRDTQEMTLLQQTHTFVALEITHQSIPYLDWKPIFPLVIVLGSEQNGVSQTLLNQASQAVHLPMYGVNLSMNVAMAASILVYYCLQYLNLNPHS